MKTGAHASVKLAEGYDVEEAALKLGAFDEVILWVREHVHNVGHHPQRTASEVIDSLVVPRFFEL